MSERDKGAEGVEWEDEAEDEMEIEWAERDKGAEGVEWVKGVERIPLSPITPFIPINSGYIPFQTSMQSSSNSAFAPMENPKNS